MTSNSVIFIYLQVDLARQTREGFRVLCTEPRIFLNECQPEAKLEPEWLRQRYFHIQRCNLKKHALEYIS
jgi:hypothetical protein